MHSVRHQGRVLMYDQAYVIDAVRHTLEPEGYNVTGHETEQEVIDEITAHLSNGSNGDISVLIVHIDLDRGRDGIEAAKRMMELYDPKSHDNTPPTVVFKASSCYDPEREQAKQLTDIGVVDVPLDKISLIRLVNKANTDFYRRKRTSQL